MGIRLDRWITAPLHDRIEVTGSEYVDLIEGRTIMRDSEELSLEDGPFKIVSSEAVERHHGPGPHPGTGTEQTVHAGNGGGKPGGFRWERLGRPFINKMEAMEWQADRLRKDTWESSYFFTDAGLILETTDVNPNRVTYTDQDLYALRELRARPENTGLINMHNHPDHEGLGVDTPPSFSDFDFAMRAELDEFWVITANGKYVVRRGERSKPNYSGLTNSALQRDWTSWAWRNYSNYGLDVDPNGSFYTSAMKSAESASRFVQMRKAQIKYLVEDTGIFEMEFIPK